ncbi:[protein-PII] uridylyltransferase family protein [Stieleria varia]|uniref:Glutamate-ammonia-ligase adenylyltransferase n=1 Tax=Stieleria varia TaxID=2528005 RepID=A0A5C6AEE2_9BACT|nr:glutamate-ammonia-ligase adenylyltransferase [Stieleria varia]TWT98412.1 Glutamate-ammonia-ligase adenylyltransferase [Stieleria varia]
MQQNSEPAQPPDPRFTWLPPDRFRDLNHACQDLAEIWSQGIPDDLLDMLRRRLTQHFGQLDDLDSTITNLSRFIAASRSPTSLLALFERDAGALQALLQVFGTSQTLANRLIADPESFDLMRASDGQPAHRDYLVDELTAELEAIDSPVRAALAIRKFTSREIIRIAYGEFVRNLSPDHVGQQLAYVSDAVLEAAFQFTLRRLSQRCDGVPQRVDGQTPQVCVIGLGAMGGEEMGYGSAMQLVFLYDAIEEKNASHRQFYEDLVRELIDLIVPDETFAARSAALALEVDLSLQPLGSERVICSVDQAVANLEAKGRTWQRMSFVKARYVAGNAELAEHFLNRIEPWIYRRFTSQKDFADVRTLRRKLQRRARMDDDEGEDVYSAPGGRADIELAIQFLQLLHGGDLPSVRLSNTSAAIVALERETCLTHQESTLLASNYARLCRLQHQLSVLFGRPTSTLPHDEQLRRRLAWQLGIRSDDGSGGDLARFQAQLDETFAVNRRMINHLLADAPSDPAVDDPGDGGGGVSVTDLVLDPEPDAAVVQSTLQRYALRDIPRAMENLIALSEERSYFLSPRRCRHFLASIAPTLLAQISQTPHPDATLETLVRVTDSIGGKAYLWELLGNNRPTMELMVRLCASTPYLTQILIDMPGMIDELIDSLSTNRLPTASRLDAKSIELCRGATDIDLILSGFKNSAHLMIGTRDMLGLEPIEATHCAISDTAESCVRRVAEFEQEKLALQFGDPATQSGEPAELLAVALGKFGGREPNYHSDLDVVFLYSADGETQRRVGGPRRTTTNQHFFNSLTQRIITRINDPSPPGRLYELDGRLRPTGEEGLLAVSLDDFIKRFEQGVAPLWQRLALCKARVITGSRLLRQNTTDAIVRILSSTRWTPKMADEIRAIRLRMQQTADVSNLKRGDGGTVDVEFICQMLTLKHIGKTPQVLRAGTTDSLQALAKFGCMSEEDSLQLITSYRVLRGIEANLRLMNTPARHELPESQESLENLAFLMGENDPAMILAQVRQARQTNRRIFSRIFDDAAM